MESTASEDFQRQVTSVISDIPSNTNSQHDFVVFEKTLQEYEKRLRKFSLKIRGNGLKLHKTECQIRKQPVVFLGHIILSEGIKTDPSKNEAITKMPLPRPINELPRFIGMVKYRGKFMPNLVERTIPLRNLLQSDVVSEQQKPQLDAIENLKALVTAAPCLKIFDSKLATRLKTDASLVGLGAFLEQSYGTVDKKKVTPYWLFIASSTGLRQTLRTDRKGNPLFFLESKAFMSICKDGDLL